MVVVWGVTLYSFIVYFYSALRLAIANINLAVNQIGISLTEVCYCYRFILSIGFLLRNLRTRFNHFSNLQKWAKIMPSNHSIVSISNQKVNESFFLLFTNVKVYCGSSKPKPRGSLFNLCLNIYKKIQRTIDNNR